MLVIDGKGISGLMTCSDSPRGLCSGQLSGLGIWHTARYRIQFIRHHGHYLFHYPSLCGIYSKVIDDFYLRAMFINPRRMREGYGSWFVCLSVCYHASCYIPRLRVQFAVLQGSLWRSQFMIWWISSKTL